MVARPGEAVLAEDARRHSSRETYTALLNDGVLQSARLWHMAALLGGVAASCTGLLSSHRSARLSFRQRA